MAKKDATAMEMDEDKSVAVEQISPKFSINGSMSHHFSLICDPLRTFWI